MRRVSLVAAALALLPSCQPAKPRVRVACVGDSITAGSGIEDPAARYPAVLGRLLGPRYEVRNFGVAGATLLASGDLPYSRQASFGAALAFQPDVVVIALGTNDAKAWNWGGRARFVSDAVELAAAFRRSRPDVRIFLCLPPPVVGPGAFGIRGNVVRDEVTPLVEQAAKESGAEVIDLYQPLSGKPDLIPDRVHPGVEGARLLADAVSRAIATR